MHPVDDVILYWAEVIKIANFKHNCKEKSIKFTSPIRFLLAMGK